MCASVWFEFFDGLLQCQNPWYVRGKCDNKEGELNWEHRFPKVLGYERSGIKEGDITEIKYISSYQFGHQVIQMQVSVDLITLMILLQQLIWSENNFLNNQLSWTLGLTLRHTKPKCLSIKSLLSADYWERGNQSS